MLRSVPTTTLHNGAEMPLLGYGTWQAKDGELETALDAALQAGYRLVDTAYAYGNERVIGSLLSERWFAPGRLSREDLFLVTKLPPVGVQPGGPAKYLRRSLEALRVDCVDLYLVHTPFRYRAGVEATDHVAVWREMEEQVDAGRTKAIGLSNFNMRQIQNILDHCRIKPANLQVELHLYMQQRPLVEFCQRNGITVTAYSPIGSPGSAAIVQEEFGADLAIPDLTRHPDVAAVARKHGRQPGQVLLRHIVQRGVAAIPKSVSRERIAQNAQLFDFALDEDDTRRLDAADREAGGRLFDYTYLGVSKDNPVFPFNEYP